MSDLYEQLSKAPASRQSIIEHLYDSISTATQDYLAIVTGDNAVLDPDGSKRQLQEKIANLRQALERFEAEAAQHE